MKTPKWFVGWWMKGSWSRPIENGTLYWAVELEDSDGYVQIILKVGGSGPWFETRKDARMNATFWRSRDYIKRATVIRVRITKEN